MNSKEKTRVLVVGPKGTPGGSETVARVILNSPLSEKYDLRHFDITRKHGKEYIGQFTVQNAYWALRFLARFVKTSRNFRPHIVHFPVASPKPALLRDYLFAIITKRSKARLILHNHAGDFDRRYQERGRFWQAFTRNYLSQSDALICLSPYWKDFFDNLGLPLYTVVIYNPIDPRFLTELERAPKIPHDDIRVLFVGALCEPKGVPELLRSTNHLMETYPNLIARLIGHRQFPGQYEKITNLHQNLKHKERIYLLGERFGADLAEEYKNADIFVLPSHWEGVPMVILEAMSAGLPVVATRVGGIPDVLQEGENGLLIQPKDEKALCEALARLINDDNLRKQMGTQNRVKALKEFGVEKFVSHCDALYQEILRERER